MASSLNANVYHGNKEYTPMSAKDWSDKSWGSDKICFHMPKCNPMLVKNIDALLRGRKNVRIFFPLCGKAVDMKWLYDEGHSIVGLEGSAKGVQEFFKENNFTFSSESVADGKFTLYKNEDNRIRIFCGDIYDFNSALGGKMQGIWDRGSFVAINREDREKYSKILMDLMDKDCHYLLDTFQYDSSEYAGPPHPTKTEEVHKLFGEKCEVTQLEERDAMTGKQKDWGLSKFQETVFELTLK